MSQNNNFFCKEGYRTNNQAQSFNFDESEEYWTQERLDHSVKYQYYVYKLASEIAQKRKYVSVLDIGCGPGTKADFFPTKILKEIILIDQPNCEKLVREIIPSAQFIATDLEKCEILLDKKFEMIICADVLEHLLDPTPCLQFARRHLTPSGLIIFSTPERDILRGKHCMHSPHPSHFREWNSEEFKCLLQYSGFQVYKQLYYPIEMLSMFDNVARLCLNKLIKLNHWNACQVAICSIGY